VDYRQFADARFTASGLGAAPKLLRSDRLKAAGLPLSLRTFLNVSRFAELPTVWSNCMAGWWLAGAGRQQNLPFLILGATCLFLGGAFLNDAFDADYDRQHRRGRPIATGLISWRTVWRWGVAWLALGAPIWFWIGATTGGFGLILVFCIVFYDATHRAITLSPVLQGFCRLLLYMAAAAAGSGVNGWPVWCGLALTAYVAGLGIFGQTRPGSVAFWPALLLACPILLALLMDTGSARAGGLLLSAVLALWVIRCLRSVWWSRGDTINQAVAGLSAGIIFVDWLAVADAPREFSAIFPTLFAATLLFQRIAAAT